MGGEAGWMAGWMTGSMAVDFDLDHHYLRHSHCSEVSQNMVPVEIKLS